MNIATVGYTRNGGFGSNKNEVEALGFKDFGDEGIVMTREIYQRIRDELIMAKDDATQTPYEWLPTRAALIAKKLLVWLSPINLEAIEVLQLKNSSLKENFTRNELVVHQQNEIDQLRFRNKELRTIVDNTKVWNKLYRDRIDVHKAQHETKKREIITCLAVGLLYGALLGAGLAIAFKVAL